MDELITCPKCSGTGKSDKRKPWSEEYWVCATCRGKGETTQREVNRLAGVAVACAAIDRQRRLSRQRSNG